MARIRAAERGGQHLVTVRGPREAADLRRLENACGRALEQRVPPLAVELDSPPRDPAAEAYLDRLRARGGVVNSGRRARG